MSLAGGWIEVASIVHSPGEVVVCPSRFLVLQRHFVTLVRWP